jgi:hypothetical protein
MIIRSSKEQIQEYINSPAMNQSKLKLLSISAQAFQEVKEPEMFFEEKEHFVIGKGVDDLITMGQEYFDENYHISDITKPSDTIMSIVQQVFQSKESDNWFDQNLLPAIEAHNYQPNWKPDTKITKVSVEGETYWNELLQSENKQILSKEQILKIDSIANQILEHRFTKDYFKLDEFTDIYYQLPIYFTVDNIECKALLDMVIVHHRLKTIIPVDIKTIGDYTKFFDYQCLRRRYDIQASWYMQALFNWRDINYERYSVKTFKFIVASTTKQCDPVIFDATNNFINAGKYGSSKVRYYYLNSGSGELEESATETYGWKKLLKIYNWHNQNGWDKDYEIETNNGIFTIDSDYQRS